MPWNYLLLCWLYQGRIHPLSVVEWLVYCRLTHGLLGWVGRGARLREVGNAREEQLRSTGSSACTRSTIRNRKA